MSRESHNIDFVTFFSRESVLCQQVHVWITNIKAPARLTHWQWTITELTSSDCGRRPPTGRPGRRDRLTGDRHCTQPTESAGRPDSVSPAAGGRTDWTGLHFTSVRVSAIAVELQFSFSTGRRHFLTVSQKTELKSSPSRLQFRLITVPCQNGCFTEMKNSLPSGTANTTSIGGNMTPLSCAGRAYF
jgi:hypothetical protein